MRATLATVRLHAATRAAPEEVWNGLTAGGPDLEHVYGMHVESDWEVGATVTVRPADLDDRFALSGEVLRADRPRRLSYTLGASGGQPSLFVTWELRPGSEGTFIRLSLDESAPDAGTSEELEVAWFPILSRLVDRLNGSVPLSTTPDVG
jgi:uncharacterized protein YndB with AHSA1/START domain